MWIILKTDHAKEFAVAEALAALGHECWVPTYVCEVRERQTVGPGITLRVRKAKERPLLPSLLLADVGHKRGLYVSVSHFQGVWRDMFEQPLLVPENQVAAFRERVNAVNAAEIVRIKKASMGKRKAKRTLKIDPNLADELKSLLFGSAAMEDAA